MKKVSSELEIPEKEIEQVIKINFEAQISRFEQLSANEAIQTIGQKISGLYGAYLNQKPNPEIFPELIKHLVKDFPQITLQKIELAFEKWALGKIDLKDYGDLNLKGLLHIIREYEIQEKKILNRLNSQIQDDKERQERIDKIQFGSQKTLQEIETEIQEAKNKCLITHFSQIPVYWYDYLKSHGKLNFTKEEADKVFEQAGNEITAFEKRTLNFGGMKIKFMSKEILIKDRESIQKYISRQMIIFEKIFCGLK